MSKRYLEAAGLWKEENGCLRQLACVSGTKKYHLDGLEIGIPDALTGPDALAAMVNFVLENGYIEEARRDRLRAAREVGRGGGDCKKEYKCVVPIIM